MGHAANGFYMFGFGCNADGLYGCGILKGFEGEVDDGEPSDYNFLKFQIYLRLS